MSKIIVIIIVAVSVENFDFTLTHCDLIKLIGMIVYRALEINNQLRVAFLNKFDINQSNGDDDGEALLRSLDLSEFGGFVRKVFHICAHPWFIIFTQRASTVHKHTYPMISRSLCVDVSHVHRICECARATAKRNKIRSKQRKGIK